MTTTTLTPELLDQLLADYEKPGDLTGDDGLFRRLKKALIERALGAELTDHLGYERGDPAGRGSGNSRNGVSAKTVLTEDGEVQIEVPRDRAGTFEPQLFGKTQQFDHHARRMRTVKPHKLEKPIKPPLHRGRLRHACHIGRQPPKADRAVLHDQQR